MADRLEVPSNADFIKPAEPEEDMMDRVIELFEGERE